MRVDTLRLYYYFTINLNLFWVLNSYIKKMDPISYDLIQDEGIMYILYIIYIYINV